MLKVIRVLAVPKFEVKPVKSNQSMSKLIFTPLKWFCSVIVIKLIMKTI